MILYAQLHLHNYCVLLDIIHHLLFYLKQNVSETKFCPRLQVNVVF
jgi:hypothetical protein